jgi:hypothetical protein
VLRAAGGERRPRRITAAVRGCGDKRRDRLTRIASKKRLLAAEQQERFVVMETIRRSVVEYYDLILAQSRISDARAAVDALRSSCA